MIEVIILARARPFLGRIFGPRTGAGTRPARIFLALGGLWASQKRLFSLFFGPQKPANLGPKKRALDTKIRPEFRPGPFWPAKAR